MKKLIAIFTLAFMFAQVTFAQEEGQLQPSNKNIIKVSPFHFADGTFLMSYERMLGGDASSIMLTAGLHSKEQSWNNSSSSGFQGEVQYRFYVAKPRNYGARGKSFFYFKGIYAAPYFKYRYREQATQIWDWVTQVNTVIPEKINEYAGGVLMGVQFALVNKVYIDFFTGGGIQKSTGRNTDTNRWVDVTSPGYNGVLPKVGFQIGVGF